MSEQTKSAVSRIHPWAILGTALVTVIVVLVNYISARRYERWDMTRDRLFTLSERTDIAIAKKTVESNDYTLKYLRDQTLPQADVVGVYGLTGLGSGIAAGFAAFFGAA